MQFQTIADIYTANDQIRNKLRDTMSQVTEEQASALPDGGAWSIADIVEHVAIVNGGMHRICSKLLLKAEVDGKVSNGRIDLEAFFQKTAEAGDAKLEAPDMVRPKGGQSIAESLDALERQQKAFAELIPLFEKFDGNESKFPHPYFGDLSAIEWLVLAGGHEARHLRQIRRLLEKLA